MYRVVDNHGETHARVYDLRDAKRLAVGFGVDMLHQLMRTCDETDVPAQLWLNIGIYPYNGESGRCCFHVLVAERLCDGDYEKDDYYDVIVED